MKPASTRWLCGVGLLVIILVVPAAAREAASSEDTTWEVLVPAGRLGRFGLRVERAEFAGPLAQVASRIARSWSGEPWPVLTDASATEQGLSRLTPAGIEAVSLHEGMSGRVEARRSILAWRGEQAGLSPGAPEPVFVASLGTLGEPLPGFASVDGDTGNLTRVWLVPGDVGAISRRVERIAASRGLVPLMRFDAPADAGESLRGGRVLAFGGNGVVAVVTFNRHAAGVAVVVHCQERLP